MFELKILQISQSGLRNQCNIGSMIEYVKQGGFWTAAYMSRFPHNKLIQISCFEDGQHFIHDGHHRSVSTWLAGRKYLRDDEYEITTWTYDQYTEINYKNGWITPFDRSTKSR